MIIALIGPPGSGKGTYSKAIAEKYGFLHIEPGRMLRDEMARGSEIGKEITPIMNAGKIPPIHITIKLVEQKLRESRKNDAVFDGYPRTIGQAEAMERFARPDLVINLEVPGEILIEKIMARRTCPRCGAIYNLSDVSKTIANVKYELPSILPKKDGICDQCNSELVNRTDQTSEIIQTRLRVHEENSKPIVDYYEKRGLFRNLRVTSGKEEMLKVIFKMIDEKAKNI